MQVSINIQDDLYKRFVESGADIQTKFNEYLVTLLDKTYFNDALNKIENGSDNYLVKKNMMKR